MRDPWKYFAFMLAGVSGYFSASVVEGIATQSYGMPELPGNALLIAFIGLFTGFLIDELIPAWIEKVRNKSGGSNGFDADAGGGGEDFDFDS